MGKLENESQKFRKQCVYLKKIEETLYNEVTLILNTDGQTYILTRITES